MMKTSATYSALGLQEGIHWHINPDVKIEYRTDSANAEIIPWVRYINRKTGETRIYRDTDINSANPGTAGPVIKTMDCIDCHNRPSHNFLTPQNFIDDAITAGAISRKLPNIKVIAMQVLTPDYPSKDSAFTAITSQINEFYTLMYPDLAKTGKTEIKQAITAVQNGYSRNIFPEMKVKWSVYPLHLGHLESNGCYRCHNDRHISDDGHTISRNCNLCHHILAQGKPGEMEYSASFESLDFHHPAEINEAWKVKLCSECHHQLY
jgi:formate-dependent nitrite reductase cytochrome c552 subunit